MRLFLPKSFILLCALFVLIFTIQVKSDESLPVFKAESVEKSEDDAETNQVVAQDVDDLDQDETSSGTDEIDEAEAEASHFENKQRWKKRRGNKFQHSSNHRSSHQKNKKHHHWRKHDHVSERKFTTRANRTAIPCMVHSSQTSDQLNKVIDEMLALFTQTLETDNLNFTLRNEHFHVNMKTFPWMFVVYEDNVEKNQTVMEKTKSVNPDISLPKKETVKFASITDDVEEEDNDTTNLEDQKSSNAQNESDTSAETPSITVYPIDASTKEEIRISEDDDEEVEDDDDDDTNVISGNVTDANVTRFNLTDKPSPVSLPDGTVEYNLKMLSEDEIQKRRERFSAQLALINFLMVTTSSDCDCNFNTLIFMCCEDESRKLQPRASKKMKRKYRRIVARRYLKRTKVQLEGISQIERFGDVLQGSREKSYNHIIDTQLQIGPIQFVMSKVSGFDLQTRVKFPTLIARLRLMVSGEGNLLWARLNPIKIQPHEVIITLDSKEDDTLPTLLETARIVTYLSHETTSAWNSGYILRRIKRRFKNLFMRKTENKKTDADKKTELNCEKAQKLVKTLLGLPTSSDQQLSTVTPILIEDVTISPSS